MSVRNSGHRKAERGTMSKLRHITTLTASIVGASLLLAAGSAVASARNLSVSNQNMRATWARLTIGVFSQCPVTLEGSFHSRSFTKAPRSLVGAITRALVNRPSCVVTEFSPKTETLPWHVTYESFTGTLPNISGINFLLSRFRFLVTIGGFCTNAEYGQPVDNITLRASREAGGALTTIEPVEGRNILRLVRGGPTCPVEIRMQGPEGIVTLLNSSTGISVTLI